MDRNFGWCDEPEFHSVPSHFQHLNADTVADDEFFSPLAAEKQHLCSLLTMEFFDFAEHRFAPRSWTRVCKNRCVAETWPLATSNCNILLGRKRALIVTARIEQHSSSPE
jgi:hypothetical protein